MDIGPKNPRKEDFMFKVGILGSENSHALAFAQLANLPDPATGEYRYPDMRITAICGCDDTPEHAAETARQGNIEKLVSDPTELLDEVDAIMIDYRDGKFHIRDVMPFIERGLPVWIDKPITASKDDRDTLRRALEARGTLFTGGSSFPYNYEVLTAKNAVKNKAMGEVLGGSVNFPGDFSSPYSGIFFYGPHLVTIVMEVFGYDLRAVSVQKVSPQNAAISFRYDDKIVTGHLNGCPDHCITVFGSKLVYRKDIDMSFLYALELDAFVNMLRDRKMPLPFDELFRHVDVLDAIRRSDEQNGAEIPV